MQREEASEASVRLPGAFLGEAIRQLSRLSRYSVIRFPVLALAALLLTGASPLKDPDQVVFSDMIRDMVGPWEEHRGFNTAAEAEAYAERLCTAVYSDRNETTHQLPFHAGDEGDTWRVVGSRPYGWPLDPFTGPMTILIEKSTGKVRNIFFTCAPAGWDAEILRKLGRDPYPHSAEP